MRAAARSEDGRRLTAAVVVTVVVRIVIVVVIVVVSAVASCCTGSAHAIKLQGKTKVLERWLEILRPTPPHHRGGGGALHASTSLRRHGLRVVVVTRCRRLQVSKRNGGWVVAL